WFYLAGLVLAFTPCVLPMVPILSGIIAGGGRHITPARGFALSAAYVLGMALTYTVAGIACAAAGHQVQAVFQQWWVLALFALVLVVLGASAGRLLPRAGPWMELVKKLFGVMMLAVAAWMLVRIVPERVALLLWAVPALVLAALLWAESRARSAAAWGLRVAAVVAGLYGVALTAASALGGTDPLAPLPALGARAHALPFHVIKSVADLDRGVAEAKASGRTVLVDF